MLIIRRPQLNLFANAQRRSFDERMVVHLQKFFQPQCDVLGDAGIRDAIADGVQRARRYALTTERDVCKYLDVMFALGRDFDTDPRFDWAQPILTEVSISPSARIDALYDAAVSRIRQAADAAPAQA